MEPPLSVQQRLEAAVEKLDVLGTTNAVGFELAAQGIQARPGCATSCVLAEYFIRELGLDVRSHVEVDGPAGLNSWYAKVVDLREDTGEVELPPHVGKLASEFDAGRWPQLEVGR